MAKRELITCQLCGRQMTQITTQHLTKSHNMSTKEYKKLYPEKMIGDLIKEDLTEDIIVDEKVLSQVYEEGKLYRYEKEKPTVVSPEIKVTESISPNINIFTKPSIQIEELEDEKFSDDDSFKTFIPKVEPDKFANEPDINKRKLLNFLSKSGHNIRNNFMIDIKDQKGKTIHQVATDMANISKKIDFEFINSFWHNVEMYYSKEIRDNLLRSQGWKVVNITSKNPNIGDLTSFIKK